MSNIMVGSLNNTVDGINTKVSKDGMTITINVTMNMKRYDENYKKDKNPNISTVLEFKNMAELNVLTCD